MKTTLDSMLADPDVLVDVARSPSDRVRILREVEGRTWASSHGISTATTLAHADDGAWVATQLLVDQPGFSMAYIESAWETAERLRLLDHPRFVTGAATWRAPRRSVPRRAWRLFRAGIDPATFIRTRHAAAMLPNDTTAHHDYHRDNVLNTPAPGGVTVLDWEYTSLGPRYGDFIRLIVDIEPEQLAVAAWQHLLDQAPDDAGHLVATQLRWLSLRTLASEVDLPAHAVQPDEAARRRRRWKMAQQWTAEIDPGVGR